MLKLYINLNSFIIDIALFVQTSEPSDFTNSNINFLEPTFLVDETHFKLIPSNSLVILDDYTYDTHKQKKGEFLKIINYNLRHNSISLILILHNLLHNNLFSDILYAPHLFISYSNMGYSIMRWDGHFKYGVLYIHLFISPFQKTLLSFRGKTIARFLCISRVAELSFCLHKRQEELYRS